MSSYIFGAVLGRLISQNGSAKLSKNNKSTNVKYRRTPAIVDLKERFGDLEIDTVIGSNHKGALVTINDRLTSKVWIRKLSGKDAVPVGIKDH